MAGARVVSSAMKEKQLLKHDFKGQVKPQDWGEVFEPSTAKKGLETIYTHRDDILFL